MWVSFISFIPFISPLHGHTHRTGKKPGGSISCSRQNPYHTQTKPFFFFEKSVSQSVQKTPRKKQIGLPLTNKGPTFAEPRSLHFLTWTLLSPFQLPQTNNRRAQLIERDPPFSPIRPALCDKKKPPKCSYIHIHTYTLSRIHMYIHIHPSLV